MKSSFKKIIVTISISVFLFQSSCVTIYHPCGNKCSSGERFHIGSYRDIDIHPVAGFFLYDLILDPILAPISIITNIVTLRFIWDHECTPFAGLINTFLDIATILPFYHHDDEWVKNTAWVILIIATVGSGAMAASQGGGGYKNYSSGNYSSGSSSSGNSYSGSSTSSGNCYDPVKAAAEGLVSHSEYGRSQAVNTKYMRRLLNSMNRSNYCNNGWAIFREDTKTGSYSRTDGGDNIYPKTREDILIECCR
jgi:hypothetical protein